MPLQTQPSQLEQPTFIYVSTLCFLPFTPDYFLSTFVLLIQVLHSHISYRFKGVLLAKPFLPLYCFHPHLPSYPVSYLPISLPIYLCCSAYLLHFSPISLFSSPSRMFLFLPAFASLLSCSPRSAHLLTYLLLGPPVFPTLCPLPSFHCVFSFSITTSRHSLASSLFSCFIPFPAAHPHYLTLFLPSFLLSFIPSTRVPFSSSVFSPSHSISSLPSLLFPLHSLLFISFLL